MTEQLREQLAPVVPWATFLPWFVSRWEQGDHCSIVGATKSGKTVLAHELLEARTAASDKWFTAVLANKPKDSSLDRMASNGWVKVRDWPPPRSWRGKPAQRVLLWPKLDGPEGFGQQAVVFDRALRQAFQGGKWALYADEVRYLSHTLGLKALVELIYLQGRSIGVTMVAATQRAAWVPLEFYSQARHLFLFAEASPANRRRLVEHCGGANGAEVARIVATLGRHEVLYVDTHEGTLLRTRVVRG